MDKPDFANYWCYLSAKEKRDFAERCNCHYNLLSSFSNGRQIPSQRLARAMKVAANGALDSADLCPEYLVKKLRIRQVK